jgi:ABC-type phosphate transport system substrate-binding protein
VNIPLAVAALLVVYNVPGISASAHLRLDGTVLVRIFSGKIGRWDDPAIAALNPGVTLPGAAIVPVHRADSSGSTFLFTSYLNAQDPSGWSSSLIGTTVAWPRPPSATRAQDLRAFLSWAVTTGTAQLAKVNFQPLPPSIVALSDAQIAKIKG